MVPVASTLIWSAVAGLSYEGFVIENLIQAAAQNTQVPRLAIYYRTQDGAEIDLVVKLNESWRYIFNSCLINKYAG